MKTNNHTRESLNAAIDSICDIMRRGNCAGALQYVPELTWILFLRILDEREMREKDQFAAVGRPFKPTLSAPYRWRDWADTEGKKRKELDIAPLGAFFHFVRFDLFPSLRKLKNKSSATDRQKTVSEIISRAALPNGPRIDTERNFRDVLNRIHEITAENIDDTHTFLLSQIYEGLLLKMGQHGGDAGQFFTPREVIRAMARVINPQIGETVLDPCCGTGGFLAQACEYIRENNPKMTPRQLARLAEETFYGREKEILIYPIALANLILHGIDKPNIWHGNTLTSHPEYAGLFQNAPPFFDVVLTNPPFGGKESVDAQIRYDYKSNSTQALFVQEILQTLKEGGRCGIVLDEGFMFRVESGYAQTKRKLLNECELHCVVSLAPGVFSSTGAGVKTNLLFFKKGKATGKIWYYELNPPPWKDKTGKVRPGTRFTKKYSLTLAHFEDFFRLLPKRAESENSWTVDFIARKKEAVEKARPLKEEARQAQIIAAKFKREIARLQKDKLHDENKIVDLKDKIKTALQKAKQAQNRAAEIETAIYDIKAINPNRKSAADSRTPEKLLAIIEKKQSEIASALARLKK